MRFRPSPVLWVVLVAFALFVWPSCYHYHTTSTGLYRVHRLTHNAQVWTGEAWSPRY